MSGGRKLSADDAIARGLHHEPGAAPSVRQSLAAARRRLGGRPGPLGRYAPGCIVEARLRDAMARTGVVLSASGPMCDVWFDDGIARRVRADRVSPVGGAIPDEIVRVAAEVNIFVALVEGQRVFWERSSGIAEAAIVEKCRYGAIVVTHAGKLVAVGFRKLWPAVAHGVA